MSRDPAQSTVSIVDAFRVTLANGKAACVEDFISKDDTAPQLLLELIAVEVSHRQFLKLDTDVGSYRQRFPALDVADLDRILSEVEDPARESTVIVSGLDHETGHGIPGNDLPKSKAAPPLESIPMPEMIGRFRVLEKLGAGRMGCVYLARDTSLERLVAIKVPKSTQSRDESIAYLEEAKRVATLDHPNIVPVYDADILPNDSCFVVSKYIPGKDLQQFAGNKAMNPQEATRLIALLADALQHAHERGVIHRDVKPANILIDQSGNPLLTDFGLAIAEKDQQALRGQTAGSPAYMAPEQVLGQSEYLDGRCDTWALGIVLFELLTSKRPFSGTVQQVFDEILNRPVRSPRMYNPRVPPELDRIVMKCLQKPIADRYPSAADLANDLRAFLNPVKWRWWVVAAGVLVTAGTLWTAGTLFSNRPDPLVDKLSHQLSEQRQHAEKLQAQQHEFLAMVSDIRAELAQKSAGTRIIAPKQQASMNELVSGLVKSIRTKSGVKLPATQSQSESTSNPPSENPPVVASSTPSDVPSGQEVEVTTELPEVQDPGPLPPGFSHLLEQYTETKQGTQNDRYRAILDLTNDLNAAGLWDHSAYYAREMVDLSDGRTGRVEMATGQLGLALYKTGRIDEAVFVLEQGLQSYLDILNKLSALPDFPEKSKGQSQMARMIGIQLLRMGNALKDGEYYDRAADVYTEAEELVREYGRDEVLVDLLLGHGSLKSARGDHARAIELLEQGASLAATIDDQKSLASCHTNLGNAYSRTGQKADALASFQRAYDCLPDDASYSLRTLLLRNWVMELIEQGNNQEALIRLRELAKIARDDDKGVSGVLKLLPALEKQIRLRDSA